MASMVNHHKALGFHIKSLGLGLLEEVSRGLDQSGPRLRRQLVAASSQLGRSGSKEALAVNESFQDLRFSNLATQDSQVSMVQVGLRAEQRQLSAAIGQGRCRYRQASACLA